MKAICYFQLVATHSRSGSGALTGVAVKQMSQRHPRIPIDGARIIRLELNIPDDAFRATQVNVTIPIEKLAAQVTAEVK